MGGELTVVIDDVEAVRVKEDNGQDEEESGLGLAHVWEGARIHSVTGGKDIRLQNAHCGANAPAEEWRFLERLAEILALGKPHQDDDCDPQSDEEDVDKDAKGISGVGTETRPGRDSGPFEVTAVLEKVEEELGRVIRTADNVGQFDVQPPARARVAVPQKGEAGTGNEELEDACEGKLGEFRVYIGRIEEGERHGDSFGFG
ncbi:MAG: hypothetical protein Q9187_003760 [Circinaria calcarea]